MNISSIANYIKKRAKNVAPINNTLKIDFGKEFIFIDGYNHNKVSLENKKAECTIKITKKNFSAILNDKLSVSWAFFTGKIKVEGNTNVVKKIKEVLK